MVKKIVAYQGTITNDTTEIESAIAAGYTLFDTAIAYRNEAVLAARHRQSQH
jgi:diketogulonate reductase-like aldo/keto reductase